jgi:L-ascorbate metabolism protein UlaG (beta-lactamase superfamily)
MQVEWYGQSAFRLSGAERTVALDAGSGPSAVVPQAP